MAFPDCDPRNGGTCASMMAKKFISTTVAILQVIIWGFALLALIFKPSSVVALIEKLDTAHLVIAYLVFITCLGFNCLLVAGLFKNNQLCVKIYLFYVVVFCVFLILDFIISIFTEAVSFKDGIFTSLFILLTILWFFVVRSYYLLTYSTTPSSNTV